MRYLIFLLIMTLLVGCKSGGGGSADGGSTDPGDTIICQDPEALNFGFEGICEYGPSGGPQTFSGWYTRDFLLDQPNLGEETLTDADSETIYSLDGKFAYGTTDSDWGDYFTGVKNPQCNKVGGYSFIGIQEGINDSDPLLIGVYVNSTTNQIEITPLGLNITCNMGFCNSSVENGATTTLQAECDSGIMKVNVSSELAHNENFGVFTYLYSVYTLISLDKIESDFTQSLGTYNGYILDGATLSNTYMLSQSTGWLYDFGWPSIGGATWDSPDRFAINFASAPTVNSANVFLGTDGFEVHSAKVFIKGINDGSGGETLGVISILGDEHLLNPGGGDYVFRGAGGNKVFYSTRD